jgi:hypothetical protein
MSIGGIAIICITVIILLNMYFEYRLKKECIHKDSPECPLGHKCVCKDTEANDN